MTIDNSPVLFENFDSEKIVFGYYNEKKKFDILKENEKMRQMNSKNKFKIFINYKDNNSCKPLFISYNVNNYHWKDLIKGKLCYSQYEKNNNEAQNDIKNLRLNLLIDKEIENKEYVKNFNSMLDNIKNKFQVFAETNFSDKKYKSVKEFSNKFNDNTYFGNIKLKKEYNEENDIKTKFYIKHNNFNKVEEKQTDYKKIMNTYYHVIPVLHISSLYIQIIGDVVQIYPQVYLEEIIIYSKTKNISRNIHYSPNIIDDDYQYTYESDNNLEEEVI